MIRAVEHIPTDMTATVDASVTLAALQIELAKGGQWLPIDPPFPERVTIGDLLAHNLSGPRRLGYGTIRDYSIGMSVRLADGRVIKSGGKVVKNVAGYDLQKLFIGAGNSLGTIVEANFKLRPRPELDESVQLLCETLSAADLTIASVLDSAIIPTILDLHTVKSNNYCLVLGFDGTREEVDWQLARARELGFCEPANFEYSNAFWAANPELIRKISVLPSKLIETIAASGGGEFVARAGNGILYSRTASAQSTADLPVHLFQRAREAFDPKNRLAPLPL